MGFHPRHGGSSLSVIFFLTFFLEATVVKVPAYSVWFFFLMKHLFSAIGSQTPGGSMRD